MLAETVWVIGCRPAKAEPDIWIRHAVKPCDTKSYEMFLCYLDGVISIPTKPMVAIEGIQKVFKLKEDKSRVPDM